MDKVFGDDDANKLATRIAKHAETSLNNPDDAHALKALQKDAYAIENLPSAPEYRGGRASGTDDYGKLLVQEALNQLEVEKHFPRINIVNGIDAHKDLPGTIYGKNKYENAQAYREIRVGNIYDGETNEYKDVAQILDVVAGPASVKSFHNKAGWKRIVEHEPGDPSGAIYSKPART